MCIFDRLYSVSSVKRPRKLCLFLCNISRIARQWFTRCDICCSAAWWWIFELSVLMQFFESNKIIRACLICNRFCIRRKYDFTANDPVWAIFSSNYQLIATCVWESLPHLLLLFITAACLCKHGYGFRAHRSKTNDFSRLQSLWLFFV